MILKNKLHSQFSAEEKELYYQMMEEFNSNNPDNTNNTNTSKECREFDSYMKKNNSSIYCYSVKIKQLFLSNDYNK